MATLRNLLKTPGGKVAASGISLAFAALAVYQIVDFLRPVDESANYSTYICTETGKPFRHKNQMGETPPILSPYSGKNTGIKAEACYWTADGGTKTEPTWVLLNESIGKNEPTFCPDCGRLVIGHNPKPGPGVKPPPTMQEYTSRNDR